MDNQANLENNQYNLELHQLIGSSLTAIVKAETMAARATLEFLIEVGYEKEKENNSQRRKLRMVTFEYNQTDEKGSIKPRTIQIPLLSLVTIPLLKIDEAQLDFEVEIKPQQSSQQRSVSSQGQEVIKTDNFRNLGSSYFEQTSVPLVIAPSQQQQEEEVRTEKMSTSNIFNRSKPDQNKPEQIQKTIRLAMKVKVGRSDMPEGISMLINLANNAVIYSVSREPEKTSTDM